MQKLSRDARPILTHSLAALGIFWTLVEISQFFVDLRAFQKWWLLPLVLVVAAVFGILSGRRPRRIEFRVPGTDTDLEIKVGDLFAQSGVRSFAVNEFFDSQRPQHVSPTSIHGQFLERAFPHSEPEARQAIDKSLEQTESEQVARQSGSPKRYPIGTVAKVLDGTDPYLLVALTHTDTESLQASAHMNDLHTALDSLWRTARSTCNGSQLTLPLLGSGLARLGLPTRQLLDTIVGSVAAATRSNKITNRISIILVEDHINHVDLRELKRGWT